uniref:Uncharacterized protein n=1 Tax=Caenorhabditis japonica TaxID=281687 RepID=A0A8R1E1C9_CAEJA
MSNTRRPEPAQYVAKPRMVNTSVASFFTKLSRTDAEQLILRIEGLEQWEAPKNPMSRGSILPYVLKGTLPSPVQHFKEMSARLPFLDDYKIRAAFFNTCRGSPEGRTDIGYGARCPLCTSNWFGFEMSNHGPDHCPLKDLPPSQRHRFMAANMPALCPDCGSRQLYHRQCRSARACTNCNQLGHQQIFKICNQFTSAEEFKEYWTKLRESHFSRIQDLASRGELGYECLQDFPQYPRKENLLGFAPYQDTWTSRRFPKITSYTQERFKGLLPEKLGTANQLATLDFGEENDQFMEIVREWTEPRPVDTLMVNRRGETLSRPSDYNEQLPNLKAPYEPKKTAYGEAYEGLKIIPSQPLSEALIDGKTNDRVEKAIRKILNTAHAVILESQKSWKIYQSHPIRPSAMERVITIQMFLTNSVDVSWAGIAFHLDGIMRYIEDLWRTVEVAQRLKNGNARFRLESDELEALDLGLHFDTVTTLPGFELYYKGGREILKKFYLWAEKGGQGLQVQPMPAYKWWRKCRVEQKESDDTARYREAHLEHFFEDVFRGADWEDQRITISIVPAKVASALKTLPPVRNQIALTDRIVTTQRALFAQHDPEDSLRDVPPSTAELYLDVLVMAANLFTHVHEEGGRPKTALVQTTEMATEWTANGWCLALPSMRAFASRSESFWKDWIECDWQAYAEIEKAKGKEETESGYQ